MFSGLIWFCSKVDVINTFLFNLQKELLKSACIYIMSCCFPAGRILKRKKESRRKKMAVSMNSFPIDRSSFWSISVFSLTGH